MTRTTPGVAADGNGFAHPLGEHADTSISIDNQPITDQQAKIFSNQISTSIVQTMEVITGAPPAEFGDKTSLIINVTTQSGLGKNKPFGSLSSQYGSFGTWSEGLTYGVGSARWGNFAAFNASGSGRFLDTPEFLPLHDHGNAEAFFDRLDWQPRQRGQSSSQPLRGALLVSDPEHVRFPGGGPGSALADPVIQHRARLDSSDQPEHPVHAEPVYPL